MGSRNVVRTIAINNGKLTYEVPEGATRGHWYRNGKIIDNPDTYRFYDKSIEGYRKLGDIRFSFSNNKVTTKVAETPVDTPYWDKLYKDKETEKDRTYSLNRAQKIPFGTKYINLRTKGRMNLATVPINLLDSIAINTGRSNTNIATNLGLVGKESTFGGRSIPIENAMYKKLGKSNPEVYENIVLDPYSITTNHAYHVNKYADYWEAINNKYGYTVDPYLYEQGKERLNAEKHLIKLENAAKDAYINNRIKDNTPHYSDNFLADSFARYAANPTAYNPGQANYVQMVDNLANEVFNEPQVQAWWNKEGKDYYEKGLKERRRLENAGKKSK